MYNIGEDVVVGDVQGCFVDVGLNQKRRSIINRSPSTMYYSTTYPVASGAKERDGISHFYTNRLTEVTKYKA